MKLQDMPLFFSIPETLFILLMETIITSLFYDNTMRKLGRQGKMKALVTGGAGFIGSHLVERLMGEGVDVRVLDNFSVGSRENLEAVASHIELVEGDVRDYKLMCESMRGIEVVFHQAALCSVAQSVEDPKNTNAVNIGGTLNVLLAARDEGVRRVVYASSCSVYGDTTALTKQETQIPAPASPYAVTKLAGELYCRNFYQLFGLQTFSLRYFNVFGPRQVQDSSYTGVIPRFINTMLRGESPVICGDGKQSRDFVYIDNVVEANLLAMKAKAGFGETYNIACGQRTTVLQLVGYLSALLKVAIQPVYRQPQPGDVRHSKADISKAKAVLGYRPNTDLLVGLERTIELCQNHVRSL